MSYAATERPSYNDDDLNSEEEEEERLLSLEHGEASDDGPKRKRSTAATSFTEADAAAAKEFEEKVKVKKSRPTFTPADLKGPKGLIAVRRSFPDQVKYREHKKVAGTGAKSSSVAQKMNRQSQITSAANYTRSLMNAYRNFARTIFPSLAPEDVLLKVEDLGSKKEIKDYLQIMRNDVRREYLEGIYGVEKTERILHELENGVTLSRGDLVEQMEVGDRPVMRRMGEAVYDEEVVGGSIERGAVVANPYGKKNSEDAPKDVGTDVSESDEEEELQFISQENSSDGTDGAEREDNNETAKDADYSPVDEAVVSNYNEVREIRETDVNDETADTGSVGKEVESNNDDEKVGKAGMNEASEDSNLDTGSADNGDTVEESFVDSEETATLAGTQETLTLVASQFRDEDSTDETEDVAMKETSNNGVDRDESDTEDGSQECTQFSQGISQFSQSQIDNTERFSQPNNTESSFQIEEQSQDEATGDVMNLGQETQAEASQEY